MLITDKVTLGDVRVNADGYLEAFARTARTGVQTYLGKEAGRPDLATVAVYRPRSSSMWVASRPASMNNIPRNRDKKRWR